MSEGPRKPNCYGCPDDFWYTHPVPMRKQGVMMHLGERFCLGSKKARRFKRSDPQNNVPGWCPRRKDPCELPEPGRDTVSIGVLLRPDLRGPHKVVSPGVLGVL